jgi:hypothetical protein
MAQSGNRPPRRSQPTWSGGTSPDEVSAADGNGLDESAAERARERLAQRDSSGQKSQNASQRARSTAPSAPRTKAQVAAGQRVRTGGPGSRRGSTKAAPKRSTAMTAAVFGTVFVVLAILVIVLVSVTGKSTKVIGFGMKPAPAAVVNAIRSVSPAALTQAGSTITSSGPYTGSIIALKKQPLETSAGKPLITYVGSNYCPYCAASRWPLVIALSRFGTFKNLRITESGRASTEPYPGTPTLSFYGSTYKSPYLSFLATEQCTDIVSSSTSTAVRDCSGYKPLQPFSALESKIFFKYDFPPYVTSTNEGGIPFVDFANKFFEDGAFMDPSILDGFTHVQIAQSLGNPVASPAQPILVSANYYTAAICTLTKNKPGSVCDMPVVKQAAKHLKL